MRRSALSGIFTSGRCPQGFSSTLFKVPKVWNCRYALKNSSVNVSPDLPKAMQDIRAKILLSAMKKAKETPSTKATIVGDRLIVNRKSYFHYQIPEKWQVNQVPQQQVEELEEL